MLKNALIAILISSLVICLVICLGESLEQSLEQSPEQSKLRELTFQKISVEPDLVISLNQSKLKDILVKCREIAIKEYHCHGVFHVRIYQGVEKGDSYAATATNERKSSMENGIRKCFAKDDPNQIVIAIQKQWEKDDPIFKGGVKGGGGLYHFYLDKTNTSIEGYTGWK